MPAANPIRLGTRASLLARTQSATVGNALAALAEREWEEILIRTPGDDTTTSLNQPGNPGLFVSTLRRALLAGEVDVIVHSFKDLPSALEPGLTLAAVPLREDPRDVLVCRDDLTFATLPQGAKVGTSSPRRSAMLLAQRPDLKIEPVRGNIDTRMRKAIDGEFDAVVLAYAGIARIGRTEMISDILDPLDVVPAPAQGALAIECRIGDELATYISQLQDPVSRITTAAEREVLVGINAECTTAIGAYATFDGTHLVLTAELFDREERSRVHLREVVSIDDVMQARAMGLRAAAELLRPSEHKPVLLVRASDNEADAAALKSLGISSVTDSYLQMTQSSSNVDAIRMLEELKSGVDWFVVTSQMAIPSWANLVGRDVLESAFATARQRGMKIAVVGAKTAETVRALGVEVDLIPREPSAAGLIKEMPQGVGSILFPHGSIAMRALPDGLSAAGAKVYEGVVYETTVVEHDPVSTLLLKQGHIGALILRSPSAARAVHQKFGSAPHIPVVVSGPTTAAEATALGFTVAAISESPAAQDMAAAVHQSLNS